MIADTASRCGCKDMNARDLVQVAPAARVAAGEAGRERGPSQTPPAFAVVHEEHEKPVLARAAWDGRMGTTAANHSDWARAQ